MGTSPLDLCGRLYDVGQLVRLGGCSLPLIRGFSGMSALMNQTGRWGLDVSHGQVWIRQWHQSFAPKHTQASGF
jgi:hypothetical protein